MKRIYVVCDAQCRCGNDRLRGEEAFPHAMIVTDAKKLAQLNAEVAKRKQKERSEHK